MPKTKEELKADRLITLIRYKAENPKLKRKSFIVYIKEQFNVSDRTAIRYWNYINFRKQQISVMLILIDQLYFRTFDNKDYNICSDLLRLKFDILTDFHR